MRKSALGRSLKAAPNFEKGLFREITLHLSVKKITKTVDSSLWLNRLHKCKPVLRNFVNTDPEKGKQDAKATASLT